MTPNSLNSLGDVRTDEPDGGSVANGTAFRVGTVDWPAFFLCTGCCGKFGVLRGEDSTEAVAGSAMSAAAGIDLSDGCCMPSSAVAHAFSVGTMDHASHATTSSCLGS